jgi:CubicO group peptidase (beta-lactamase class C family)
MLKLIKVILLITFLQGCLLMTPAQLDAKLTSFVNTSKLMGISLQITKQGNTIYRGNFGYRDYDRKLPVNNDTSFRMASLSKSMTSAGIMLLVEQGKLKLTDKVSAILGFQLTNPDFPSDQITL